MQDWTRGKGSSAGTRYTFDHKGIHFIASDNVSDPRSIVGDTQLEWLAADLKKTDRSVPIVVFTHRPLFDLYPEWEWHTRDGAKALELLMPFKQVTVVISVIMAIMAIFNMLLFQTAVYICCNFLSAACAWDVPGYFSTKRV